MDKDDLIQEYERLRQKAEELSNQLDLVDERLVEIEYLLPDDYHDPGNSYLPG